MITTKALTSSGNGLIGTPPSEVPHGLKLSAFKGIRLLVYLKISSVEDSPPSPG